MYTICKYNSLPEIRNTLAILKTFSKKVYPAIHTNTHPCTYISAQGKPHPMPKHFTTNKALINKVEKKKIIIIIL